MSACFVSGRSRTSFTGKKHCRKGIGNSMEETERKQKEYREYEWVTVLSVLVFMALFSMLTGKGIGDGNPYNTYALQAESWRQKRLDLGQDYPWLELAVFNGKYYSSFPPFPSYLLFPLTFFFGSNTPDALLSWLICMLAADCLYRIGKRLGLSPREAMLETLFVMLGSNLIFIMTDPSVWFFAQLLCFALSAFSIYAALLGKGAWSLLFLACAVGCRPMQIVFLPVILYLLYQGEKRAFPDSKWYGIWKRRWRWGIPALLVGLSYMVLNAARFKNPFEFGHNYLPEFVCSEYGQFHIHYVKENLKQLFGMPGLGEDGRILLSNMGGVSMLIVSPIFLTVLLDIVFLIYKKEYRLLRRALLVIFLSAVYMGIVVMHKTMGGWHFGNRYTNDILPWIFLTEAAVVAKYPRMVKYRIPLLIWGMGFNLVGSVGVYNGWI